MSIHLSRFKRHSIGFRNGGKFDHVTRNVPEAALVWVRERIEGLEKRF